MTDYNIPNSTFNNTSYENFLNICSAYNNELLHITKENLSLSLDDCKVMDNLLKEIYKYSSELIQTEYIDEAKNIINEGLLICNNFENIYSNISENMNHPLTLRLMLLEQMFNINFKYERNFYEAEKLLEEIKNIQNYLRLPDYNYACSIFYSSVICFYKRDYITCEKLINESLSIIENDIKQTKNKMDDNKMSKTMSKILDFMGELYKLKKDYLKVINCYEKAYYLNMGKYGPEDSTTEYFKVKLDLMNDKMKNYFPFSQKYNFSTSKINNNNIYQSQTIGKQTNENFNASSSFQDNTYYAYNGTLNNQILHKGNADTFSFKIPSSSLYEPFFMSLYRIGKNEEKRFLPELFIGNLTFDKTKLVYFLGEEEGNNAIFYNDENLNKILTNIVYINGFVSFLDNNLKNAVINSSVKIKNFPK